MKTLAFRSRSRTNTRELTKYYCVINLKLLPRSLWGMVSYLLNCRSIHITWMTSLYCSPFRRFVLISPSIYNILHLALLHHLGVLLVIWRPPLNFLKFYGIFQYRCFRRRGNPDILVHRRAILWPCCNSILSTEVMRNTPNSTLNVYIWIAKAHFFNNILDVQKFCYYGF